MSNPFDDRTDSFAMLENWLPRLVALLDDHATVFAPPAQEDCLPCVNESSTDLRPGSLVESVGTRT
ncbi:MbtH family protein [Amycolatopsis antarctica]|uniref:MbtH family protein n=1 Tax=Amycolatopsis antarctica TaxID=1854586 RepID=A0A263D472_9PSEU|nr:hypothetical protein [Amycolatopsis antarctica]OZM73282.1 MbtH family protein [Amycolatopsis antarctica]